MSNRSIYHRIVEMWVDYKNVSPNSNPSILIISELTGQTFSGPEPQNAIDLMDVIGKIQGLPLLTQEEKMKIAVEATINKPGFSPYGKGMSPLAAVTILSFAKWIGYGLGLFSLLYAGFSGWVVGFMIAFWWAGGAARMASQKQRVEPGPSWEMPAHILIHLATFIGLIVVSIKHIL